MAGPPEREPKGRWLQLGVLSLTVLVVVGTWFGGTAVAPSLRDEWGIDITADGHR